MRLEWGSTRDQALLAMVVQEAETAIEQSGKGYLGRTALQKIVYFLQSCEVPFSYRFAVHHYGPFCADILSDVDWLLLDDTLKDVAVEGSRYSNYRVCDGATDLIEQYADDVEQYRSIIHNLTKALVPLDPDRLELFSTLHYAYRELRAGHATSPEFNAVWERFQLYKGDKFSRERGERAFETLKNARVL